MKERLMELRDEVKANGWRCISVRENQAGLSIAEVFVNDEKEFLILANDNVLAPISLKQLEEIREAINDVIWMRGQYSSID